LYREWAGIIDKYLVEKKLRRIEEFLREIVSEEAPPNFDAFAANIIFKRFVAKRYREMTS